MAVLMLGTLLTAAAKQEATGYVVLEEDLGQSNTASGSAATDVALGLRYKKQLDAMIEDGNGRDFQKMVWGGYP